MITEEEAKTKWCPFARDSMLEECTMGVTTYNFNRGFADAGEIVPKSCLCIASECMAWRKTGAVGTNARGERVDRDLDGRTTWMDTGYCGLAGKP